jgi:hypothetical protein
MIYRTRGEHANHYATDAGFFFIKKENKCLQNLNELKSYEKKV